MPDFPIQFRAVDFVTDRGQVVRAKRGYLLCEFSDLPIVSDTFLVTAAPFGVVPFTISRHLTWTRVATTITRAGSIGPSDLTWQGIPCDLGTITFRLIHVATGLRSGILHMLAKFPRSSAGLALERTAVLGLSLLDENPVQLLIDNSIAETLAGHLSMP